jgi:hypothetical protein
MPDENPISEAVERVAHAVEKTTESDPPPKHDEPKKKDRLKSMASLLTAIAALLAAGGAFIKTFDHSITENAYNTLSKQIGDLSDEQQKNHEDLVKLQGYLDGVARAPLVPVPTTSATVATTSVDAGAPVPTLRPLVRPTASSAIVEQRDGGLVTFAIVAPPLPTVHPSATAVRPPPWAQVAAGK